MTRPDYVYIDDVLVIHELPHNNRPDPMDRSERMRLRAAAYRAPQVYPGPVGVILQRELLMWEEFGYRLGTGGGALIYSIVEDIMTKAGSHYEEKQNG